MTSSSVSSSNILSPKASVKSGGGGRSSINKALSDSLLTADGNKGWKLGLFISIDDDYVCPNCQNVCKKAVTLECEFEQESDEHTDEEITPYCADCMIEVLNKNNNKCPISGHENAKYVTSRMARKHIMKCRVVCPNSIAFHSRQRAVQEAKEAEEEAEGQGPPPASASAAKNKNASNNNYNNNNQEYDGCCEFEGTLSELVEVHIGKCIQTMKNSGGSGGNQFQTMMIEKLQQEVQGLSQETEDLKREMHDQKVMIDILWPSVQYLLHVSQSQQQQSSQAQKKNNNYSACASLASLLAAAQGKKALSEAQKIELKFHSQRKCYDNKSQWHAQNVLKTGGDDYSSDDCTNFSKNEADWIIFDICCSSSDENDSKSNNNNNSNNSNKVSSESSSSLYVPTEMKILNNSKYNHGIASMQVLIGSAKDNEWVSLHSSNVISGIKQSKTELQTIQLDSAMFTTVFIKERKWQQLKLVMIENHGQTGRGYSKIRFAELYVYGYRVQNQIQK